MDKKEILKYFCEDLPAIDKLSWFRESYFPDLVARLNSPNCRKLSALYNGEKIPTNERNLTDVRTRIGLIIENQLAVYSNELFRENDVNDIFWTNVVANRFPDLEVRNSNGERFIRVEVKTIQSISEEKSANFSTLIKDIDPATDYLVIFLWEWENDINQIFAWDRAPLIKNFFIFHAYSLAKFRDEYWLNSPQKSQEDGYQGFDLTETLTFSKSKYKIEGKNVGKLLRWKDTVNLEHLRNSVFDDTLENYKVFVDEAIYSGFDSLVRNFCIKTLNIPDINSSEEATGDRRTISAGKSLFYLGPKLNTDLINSTFENIFYFNNHYKVDSYKLNDEGHLVKKLYKEKPKNIDKHFE